jgi:predicted phage-related endonuclease
MKARSQSVYNVLITRPENLINGFDTEMSDLYRRVIVTGRESVHRAQEGCDRVATATKITKTIVEVVIEEPTKVLDDTNVVELIVALADAKAAIKALETQKSEIDSQIRALMGEATIGTVDGVKRVEILHRSRDGIDSKMLKEVFPEAASACATITEYTQLQAK